MKKIPPFVLVFILVAAIFAFTPFYSVSYIAIIALATATLKFSKTFSTLTGRIILSTLLLLATVMITGLITWLAKLPLHPLLVVITFGALLAIYARFKQKDTPNIRTFDTGDAVSLGLAVVAPIIVIASFYLPKPSAAALYQLGSSGWDNASHIQIIESVSLEKGYIYGHYEDVRDKIISPSNAYPQAWHLATSHIANGFSTNLFDPAKPFTTINNYFIILFVWYVIAAYCVSRTAWTLLGVIGNSYKKRPVTTIVTFTAASLLLQVTNVWGSLALGFANYLGLMAYLAVMYAILVEKPTGRAPASYFTALLMGAAGTLCWFLPIPAIVLSLALAFAGASFRYKPAAIITKLKANALLFSATVGILALILVQIGVFVVFTHVDGDEQLNATGGTFSISVAMLAIMITATGYYLYKNKADLFTKYLHITAPMLLFLAILYLYQLLSSPEPTYYFHKIAGLLAIATAIFFIPTLTHFIAALKTKSPTVAPSLIALSILSLLVVGAEQSTYAIGVLLQRNSKVTYQTAEAVVDYLKTANKEKEKLYILTDRSKDEGPKRFENTNGELGNKVSHLPYTCVNYVTNSTNGRTLHQRVRNLGKCADELKETGQRIRVIANSKTADNIRELDRDNIKLVVVR